MKKIKKVESDKKVNSDPIEQQPIEQLEQPKKVCELRPDRVFVLDTNVLLHDSQAIFHFKGVVIAIPFIVLEELDKFKKDPGEMGRNAREVIRTLDKLRNQGCLSRGVEITKGGEPSILRIIPTPKLDDFLNYQGNIEDNLIIKTAKDLTEMNCKVTLVTKDINCRVKADSLGIEAEDYIKEKEFVTSEEFYRGWTKISIPAIELKGLTLTKMPEILKQRHAGLIYPNEFIVFESENNPENNRLFIFKGGNVFREVFNTKIVSHFGAKNLQQLMTLELLRDDSIKMISLTGSAGTGKTFLTLLMGLQKVVREHLYRKFLITRPVIALGADVGYLPGELQEKLRYWMQPVYDNLELIFSQMNELDTEQMSFSGKKAEKKYKTAKKYPDKHYNSHSASRGGESSIVDLLQQKDILSLEAITYMRGRSIPYQFIFVDEVQNLNPHEVKTIVSRAGEGSKIILAGDPFQIDSPYLDFSSNGLTVTTEKFKGQSIFGSVFLEKSERSTLAELAAKIL